MTAFSDEKLEREALGTGARCPSLQGFFNEGSRRSENTVENEHADPYGTPFRTLEQVSLLPLLTKEAFLSVLRTRP